MTSCQLCQVLHTSQYLARLQDAATTAPHPLKI